MVLRRDTKPVRSRGCDRLGAGVTRSSGVWSSDPKPDERDLCTGWVTLREAVELFEPGSRLVDQMRKIGDTCPKSPVFKG